EPTVELLRRAGCQEVVQLGELLGLAMARRISGHGGRTHVVGRLDDLLIAEASAANTSFVGRTVRDIGLRERLDVNVVGLVERGRYAGLSPDSRITEGTVLLLSGTRAALDAYDRGVRTGEQTPAYAVIVGGGRVGRAMSRCSTRSGF